MQAVRIGENDRLRSHRRPGRRLAPRPPRAVQCQCQDRSFADFRRAGPVNRARYTLAVRDDDFGEQALGIGRHIIQIKLDQRRARLYFVSDLDPLREALSLQGNRVDADVHEHLDVPRGFQRHRVTRCVLLDDFARTRSAQNVVNRVNGNSVAGKLLRENRIGHAFERIDYAGDRR